jgi:AcrR family transcriptional regulator
MEAPPTKAAVTRERVLSVAAVEFARDGYAGTSMRRIAAAAGIQAGSVYFHFDSKDDLLIEIARQGTAVTLERARAAEAALGPDAPTAARLRAAIRVHLQTLGDHGAHAAAVIRVLDEAPAAVRDEHRRRNRTYSRWWLTLIRAAQTDGTLDPTLDPRLVRDLVFGMLNAGSGRPVDEVSSAVGRLLGI